MKRPTPRNYLKDWRQHRRLSQPQLADAVGTSTATISRLEAGQRGLSQKWLERLAPVLQCSAPQLLGSPQAASSMAAGVVPLIDSIRASSWADVADPYPKGEGAKWLPVQRKYGPRAFALRIQGPSMRPNYEDGDVIVVDPDVEARPGDDVVARLEDTNEATFKRLRIKSYDAKGRPVVELVPLNPDWPVLTLRRSGRIIGPAIDLFRKIR
jgi:SOS-response transcriptional repressor LexA